ncbi:MAG: hypothetical protein VYC34_08270, partial [Planctomycetota bacterium]|nr:hypothetical protein [Planctomycetota bacterium]
DPLLERTNIEGKFLLDEAPAQDPMIYVSQSGLPKIVVFGAGLSIGRPTLVTGWSDRLMLTADAPTDPLRVYYLDHRTQQATQAEVNAELSEFIEFLAHEQTPEQPSPGLNLTYSEVVGALHEIWKEDGFKAGFVAEQDRLAAELINSVREIMVAERPELLPEDEEEAEETGIFDAAPTPSLPGQRPELSPETPAAASDEDSEATDEEEPKKRRYVVPLRKSEPPK